MGKYIFMVFANAVDGKDDAFNDWYTNVHLDEVLQVPGFASGQRFEVAGDPAPDPTHNYLAMYELETDDPQATLGALNKAVAEWMQMTDTMDSATANVKLFAPVTEKRTA